MSLVFLTTEIVIVRNYIEYPSVLSVHKLVYLPKIRSLLHSKMTYSNEFYNNGFYLH